MSDRRPDLSKCVNHRGNRAVIAFAIDSARQVVQRAEAPRDGMAADRCGNRNCDLRFAVRLMLQRQAVRLNQTHSATR